MSLNRAALFGYKVRPTSDEFSHIPKMPIAGEPLLAARLTSTRCSHRKRCIVAAKRTLHRFPDLHAFGPLYKAVAPLLRAIYHIHSDW
ncbi:MAG TPA: hypothetical protein VLE73_00005 [Candidatus Saccharimonadales bacterium]|nr:hypothetical protein [Candidatus Saccharimonadales bacterium]